MLPLYSGLLTSQSPLIKWHPASLRDLFEPVIYDYCSTNTSMKCLSGGPLMNGLISVYIYCICRTDTSPTSQTVSFFSKSVMMSSRPNPIGILRDPPPLSILESKLSLSFLERAFALSNIESSYFSWVEVLMAQISLFGSSIELASRRMQIWDVVSSWEENDAL